MITSTTGRGASLGAPNSRAARCGVASCAPKWHATVARWQLACSTGRHRHTRSEAVQCSAAERDAEPAPSSSEHHEQQQQQVPHPSSGIAPRASATAASALFYFASSLAAMAADEAAVAYNNEAGSETVKNVAGVAYVLLVAIFLLRLFKRRADRATSEARPCHACLHVGLALAQQRPPWRRPHAA